MKHISSKEFAEVVKIAQWVVFEADDSAYPERIVLLNKDGSRTVIAAREDGCLDVVLEEA